MTNADDRAHRQLRIATEFFELAEELRSVFDERFLDPRALHPERFVWDYWHVPDQFTYFRTYADRYFPNSLYARFAQRLRTWGEEELGCGKFSPIWLSYYIDGCTQETHVDAHHGPWSFVYSLTRWDARTFTGGETLLRWSEPRSGDTPAEPAASGWGVAAIPARFNQLIAFDPRMPHGVARVHGTRDPREGRLVLHGWFKEPTLRCSGDLSLTACERRLQAAWPELHRSLEHLAGLEGLAVVRAEIDREGRVEDVRVIADLLNAGDDGSGSRVALDTVCRLLRTLTFAGVTQRACVTLPIRFPIRKEGPVS